MAENSKIPTWFRVPLVKEAVSFAARRHEGQYRHDGVTPYIVHPIRVYMILISELEEKDPETLAAAILHDTIEDTRTDCDDLIARFSPKVANYVALLTKDKRMPEHERECAYFRVLAKAPYPVLAIKVADSVDNLRDAPIQTPIFLKALDKAKRLLSILPKEMGTICAFLKTEIQRLQGD